MPSFKRFAATAQEQSSAGVGAEIKPSDVGVEENQLLPSMAALLAQLDRDCAPLPLLPADAPVSSNSPSEPEPSTIDCTLLLSADQPFKDGDHVSAAAESVNTLAQSTALCGLSDGSGDTRDAQVCSTDATACNFHAEQDRRRAAAAAAAFEEQRQRADAEAAARAAEALEKSAEAAAEAWEREAMAAEEAEQRRRRAAKMLEEGERLVLRRAHDEAAKRREERELAEEAERRRRERERRAKERQREVKKEERKIRRALRVHKHMEHMVAMGYAWSPSGWVKVVDGGFDVDTTAPPPSSESASEEGEVGSAGEGDSKLEGPPMEAEEEEQGEVVDQRSPAVDQAMEELMPLEQILAEIDTREKAEWESGEQVPPLCAVLDVISMDERRDEENRAATELRQSFVELGRMEELERERELLREATPTVLRAADECQPGIQWSRVVQTGEPALQHWNYDFDQARQEGANSFDERQARSAAIQAKLEKARNRLSMVRWNPKRGDAQPKSYSSWAPTSGRAVCADADRTA